MKKFLFSSNKRWGYLALLSIIILAYVIYLLLGTPPSTPPTPFVIQQDEDWYNTQAPNAVNNHTNNSYNNEVGNSHFPTSSNNDVYNQDIAYNPSPFDPNTASIESMLANGLPSHSVKRIVSYRNKGGTFYKKEKLKNFGLDDETYKKVEPYIRINSTSQTYSSNKYTSSNTYSKPAEPTNLDINAASQEEWMLFKGIGPGYSKRIIEYRDKLGGFIDKTQLKEVYGLPDSVYNHIIDKVQVGTVNIKKININTATLEELAQHPYIRKYMAEHIIKFREDIKEFKSIQELKQIPLINEEKYRKIVPYITLN